MIAQGFSTFRERAIDGNDDWATKRVLWIWCLGWGFYGNYGNYSEYRYVLIVSIYIGFGALLRKGK